MSPRIADSKLQRLRAEFEEKYGRESADLIIRLLPRVPWSEVSHPDKIERPHVTITRAQSQRLYETVAPVLGDEVASTFMELLLEGQTITA
jgi:hypothetical protein